MSQLEDWSSRLIEEAIQKVAERSQEEVITDFHVTTNSDNGEVCIYDDNDEVLAKGSIDGFEEKDENEFRKIVGKAFRQILSKMDAEHQFDSLNIFRPFSFVIADEKQEMSEDLYVVDSDTVMVSDELLKGLDDELNDFLNQLLQSE